jgi:hexosaminidase
MSNFVPFPIIPKPVDVQPGAGSFSLTASTRITADPPNQQNASFLRDLLSPPTGFPLPVSPDDQDSPGAIHLCCGGDASRLGQEGYRMTVSPDGVMVEAPQPAGVFYAIQTLRQLLPVEVERRALAEGVRWQLPACTITDWPRFSWRGYMLDEGRHFHGKQAVLDLLDLLALHKLNVFHWHLTEDQGWRIAIERYPRLVEVGSQRKGTSRGVFGKHDGVPHAGFYTQAEIREVVAYAAARHIMVVPEIEFPGHSLAALAAYPQLSCTGGPFEVCTHFGVIPELYCAGNDAVFTFLEGVLEEILALFPAPFIHIGGDEAPKKRWKQCPRCQARMRALGLKDETALQVYFTNRIAASLTAQGRRVVGWNQILGKGLDASAVAQYWAFGKKQFIQSVRAGHQAVMSPFLTAYLDHAYRLTPLRKAYDYEPVPPELADMEDRILGIEAPLWGEFVRSRARIDYQTFPRLSAYAETGWTPRAHKNYPAFRARLSALYPRLHQLGTRPAPLAEVDPPRWKQTLAILTIAQAQTRTA